MESFGKPNIAGLKIKSDCGNYFYSIPLFLSVIKILMMKDILMRKKSSPCNCLGPWDLNMFVIFRSDLIFSSVLYFSFPLEMKSNISQHSLDYKTAQQHSSKIQQK